MGMFGPIQVMVIGFDHADFHGEILAELRRLRERDLVRLVDLVVVAKGTDGLLWSVEASDLDRDEAAAFGAIAAALLGLSEGRTAQADAAMRMAVELRNGRVFTDDGVWYVADAIPPGRTAAIALLEHRWAVPVRDAIVRAGGTMLADTWLRPSAVATLDDVRPR